MTYGTIFGSSVLPRPFWRIGRYPLRAEGISARYALRMYSASATHSLLIITHVAPVASSMQDYSYLLVWVGSAHGNTIAGCNQVVFINSPHGLHKVPKATSYSTWLFVNRS